MSLDLFTTPSFFSRFAISAQYEQTGISSVPLVSCPHSRRLCEGQAALAAHF